MQLTEDEEKELEENGMGVGTVGRFYYDEQRNQRLSHRDALRNFVDGLTNMQSKSLSPEQLKILKSIIGSDLPPLMHEE
jgi:hypothetical protein